MRYSIILRLCLACLFVGPLQAAETSSDPQDIEMAQQTDDGLPSPSGETYTVTKDYKGQLTTLVLSILGIIVALLLLIWIVKKFSRGRSLQVNHRKHIKILERRHLSPNTYIYLLQIGDKQCMIAESKFQIKTLATITETEIKKEPL